MNYQNTYIQIPSWLPVPGTAIVRYDGESVPFELPAYMGQSFTELCKLTPLINEMLHEYYDGGDGVAPTKRASFAFAQGLYGRMLDWADTLPVSMARGEDMPHHAAIVHIYFHTAVLDLFRPFPYQQPETPYKLDNSAADDPTPESVCNASLNQLKHLILVFRSRYPCATLTMLWQNALLYVANACLPLQRSLAHAAQAPSADRMEGVTTTAAVAAEDDRLSENEASESEEEEDRRLWFTACVDALRDLAPQFGIVTGLVQGLLTMAILRRSIAAVEGRAIMEQVKADTEVTSRHRREQRSSRGGAGVFVDGGGYKTPGMVDAVDGVGGAMDGVRQQLQQQQRREDSEAAGRVEYGSFRARGGDAPGSAIGGLVNLPGALKYGNRFVIDLNEASVNPSAASLDVLARAFDELAMFDEFLTADE